MFVARDGSLWGERAPKLALDNDRRLDILDAGRLP